MTSVNPCCIISHLISVKLSYRKGILNCCSLLPVLHPVTYRFVSNFLPDVLQKEAEMSRTFTDLELQMEMNFCPVNFVDYTLKSISIEFLCYHVFKWIYSFA